MRPSPRKRVTIAVLTSGEKVALQRRDGNTDIYPNHWGLFGGSIEPRETPLKSVLREVREELGIRLAEAAPVGMCIERPCRLNSWQEIEAHVFTADVARGWPRRRLTEGDGCGLFDFDQIRAMKSEVTPMAFKIVACHFGRGSARFYSPCPK